MEQDWVAIAGAELIIGLALWCGILWQDLGRVGVLPLIAGILLAMLGLFGLSAVASWISFGQLSESRVVPGVMEEMLVPRWTVSSFLHEFTLVFGILLLAACPVAAVLLRRRSYNWRSVGLVLLASLAFVMWWLPLRPPQTLAIALMFRSLFVLGVGGAFFLGVGLVLRLRRKPRQDPATPTP